MERSFDGNNFETIGQVKAGVASSLGQYAFTDKVSSGACRKNDLYYRLRQVDGENKVFYLKVLAGIVRMYQSRSVTAMSVTPDPGVNDIQVNVQLKENPYVVMTVKGTITAARSSKKSGFRQENGSNMFDIEGTHQLVPGNYELEIIVNSSERMTMTLAKS